MRPNLIYYETNKKLTCALFCLLFPQVNGVTVDWHTPLFSACVSGSVACLNLLLQHGASLHPPCDLASPIHEAAKRGEVTPWVPELVYVLLAAS